MSRFLDEPEDTVSRLKSHIGIDHYFSLIDEPFVTVCKEYVQRQWRVAAFDEWRKGRTKKARVGSGSPNLFQRVKAEFAAPEDFVRALLASPFALMETGGCHARSEAISADTTDDARLQDGQMENIDKVDEACKSIAAQLSKGGERQAASCDRSRVERLRRRTIALIDKNPQYTSGSKSAAVGSTTTRSKRTIETSSTPDEILDTVRSCQTCPS
ncbi:MAG: hypothetical protein FE78DRAFT_99542 [Acidomyces sp. 'richmondensis']|nr:MAG: hypothetical protein FE78DRAFT_99542 [Acidomyces sp. 'richmondensis']